MKFLRFICAGTMLLLSTLAQAEQFVANVVTNPPSGGTIAGGGTYSNETAITLQMRGASGWYVQGVDFDGPPYPIVDGRVTLTPKEQFERTIILEGLLNPNFDPTTITNFDASIRVIGDSTTTVFFSLLSPVIVPQPDSASVLTGTTVTFSSGASGRKPISYQWQKDGTNLVGKTGSSLVLTNVQLTNAGSYALIASNAFGVTSSIPANLMVNNLLVLADGQPVAAATLEVDEHTTLGIQSVYSGAHIFYTLDGSEPDFLATPFGGSLFISNSCILRAIAYNGNFSQFVTNTPLQITVYPVFSLYHALPCSFTFDPPQTHFRSNSIVTVTAVPNEGWTLMGWQGDFVGSGLSATVRMNEDKEIKALLGTAVTVQAVGGGTVAKHPSAPLHPYGSYVRLSATPNSSNYFRYWMLPGGNPPENPYDLFVNEPNITATAIFAPIPLGQASLTLLVNGGGHFATDDIVPTSVYPIGSTTTIYVWPDAGQEFLGWSGDATGTENPLSLTINSNITVTANFTHTSALRIERVAPTVLLSLTGARGDNFRIEASTNLSSWVPLMEVTNYFETLSIEDSWTNVPMKAYRAVKP